MREEEKFSEVTLVREDQGGCGAHKVVLASASPTTTMEIKTERKKLQQKKCQGLCRDASHLCLNSIHTHRWLPRPPSSLTFRVKGLSEVEEEDMQTLAYNDDMCTPDAQEELKETGDTWQQAQWCHGCHALRLSKPLKHGEGMEDKEEVKEVRGEEEGWREWLQLLWEKVERGMEEGSCQSPPGEKRRRRGGRASRLRRLLRYQLYLVEKRGLPLSRLLSQRHTDAGSPRLRNRRVQEVSASPQLRRRGENKVRSRGGGGRGEEVREEEGEGEESSSAESVHAPKPKFSICSQLWPSPPPSTPLSAPPSTPQIPQQPGVPPFSSFPFSYTTPYTPPYTPPYSTLPSPTCGPTPGPQWVVCGRCQFEGYTTPLIFT